MKRSIDLKFSTLALGAALAFSPTSVFAADNTFFNKIEGSWKGRGFITTNVGAKEEAIRCRLKTNHKSAESRLTLTGSCGVAGVLLPMTGWMQQNGKKNSYTASMFRNLAFVSVERFTGSLSGSSLKLKFSGTDKVNKQPISANVTIKSRGTDRFDIVLGRTDPTSRKYFSVGTIKFSRR